MVIYDRIYQLKSIKDCVLFEESILKEAVHFDKYLIKDTNSIILLLSRHTLEFR